MKKKTKTVEFNCVFQPCHVTSLLGLIVPASYDKYTALVKSDGASKHVWKTVKGAYCWWKPWDTVTGTRELVQLRKRRDIFRTVL